MRPNFDRTQYLGACADIDVASDFRDAWPAPATQRYLMKDQAVHANLGLWVYDNPVRVRDQQAAANPACQRDIGARNDRPEPVWQHEQLAIKGCDKAGL